MQGNATKYERAVFGTLSAMVGEGGERGGGTGETLRGCDGFEFLVDSGFGYWKRVLLDSFGTCGPID